MKQSMTIIYVPDPAASAEFWQKAFGMKVKMIFDDNSYADLYPAREGDVSIGFVNSEDFEEMYGIRFTPTGLPRTQISLNSLNVDSDFARAVSAGARPLLPPHKTDWSLRVAYVQDPQGTVVILTGPMNPDLFNRM